MKLLIWNLTNGRLGVDLVFLICFIDDVIFFCKGTQIQLQKIVAKLSTCYSFYLVIFSWNSALTHSGSLLWCTLILSERKW